MAIEAQLFDGTILEFPDGTDPAVIRATAKRLTLERRPKEQAGFVSSALEGAGQLGSAPAAARFFTGTPEEQAAAKEELTKPSDKLFTSFADVIGGKGKFADYAKQTLGSTTGALAAPLAAAGATMLVPGVGLVAAPFVGGAVLAGQYLTGGAERQAQEQKRAIAEGRTPEEISLGKATVAAAGETALDFIGFKFFKPVFKAFPVVGKLFGEGGEKVAKEAEDQLVKAFQAGTLTYAKGMAKGVAGGVAFEVPQEIAQTALERWQAGLSLTDAEARAEYLEAGAGAVLLGSPLGGASGFMKTRNKRDQAEAILAQREADKKAAQPQEAGTTEAPAPDATKQAAPAPDGGALSELTGYKPASAENLAKLAAIDATRNPEIDAMQAEYDDRVKNIADEQAKPEGEQNTVGIRNRIAANIVLKEKINAAKTAAAAAAAAQTSAEDSMGEVKPNADAAVTDVIERGESPTGADVSVQPNGAETGAGGVTETGGAGLDDAGVLAARLAEGKAADAATLKAQQAAAALQAQQVADAKAQEAAALQAQQAADAKAQEAAAKAAVVLTPDQQQITAFEETFAKIFAAATTPKQKEDAAALYKKYQKDIGNKKSEDFLPARKIKGISERLATFNEVRKAREDKKGNTKQAVSSADERMAEMQEMLENLTAYQNMSKSTSERQAEENKAAAESGQATYKYRQEEIRAALRGEVSDESYKLDQVLRKASKAPSGGVNSVLNYLLKNAKGLRETAPVGFDNNDQLEKAIQILIDTNNRGESNFVAALTKGLKINPPKALKILSRLTELKVIQQNKETKINEFNFKAAETILASSRDLKSTDKLFEQRIVDSATKFLYRNIASVLSTVDFKTKIIVEGESTLDTPIFNKLHASGSLGAYYPKSDVIYITQAGVNDITVLHEIVHAGTIKLLHQFEIDPSKLTPDQREAIEHLKKIMVLAKKRLGGRSEFKEAFENIYEFMSYALTEPKFRAALAELRSPGLSKYTKAVQDLWSQITEAMTRLYGLFTAKGEKLNRPSSSEIEEQKLLDKLTGENTPQGRASTRFQGYEGNLALEVSEIFDRILTAPTGGVDLDTVLNLKAPSKPKTAPPVAPTTPEEVEERAKERREAIAKPKTIATATKFLFSGEGFNWLVQRYQNDRVAIKNWERDMVRAGLINYEPGTFNNTFGTITNSTGTAFHLHTQYILRHAQDVEKFLNEYAEASNLSVNEALDRLYTYMVARHEPERRRIKFLRNVPLDDAKNIDLQNGKQTSAANMRDRILKELDRNTDLTTNGEVKQLRAMLEQLAKSPAKGGYAKPEGSSPNGYKTIDESAAEYSVIGQYSPDLVRAMSARMKADPNQEILNKLFDAMKEVQKNTRELNTQSRYAGKQVNNWIEFYGYDNYMPFKGKDLTSEPGDKQNQYDTGSGGLSKEYAEAPSSFTGRLDESDNPLVQTLADGALSALRAGSKDVSTSIKNSIVPPKGIKATLKGELVKIIPYADRNTADFKPFQTEQHIFHYAENGSIEIYKLGSKAIQESIRRTFKASQPFIQAINQITSLVGQSHTRYNPSFAPMNFVRDALTNAFTMGADMGPAKSAQFLKTVASMVSRNGLTKAGNVARLYAEGKVGEIEAIAKNDPFVKDVLEYLKEGGRVSYIQGLAIKGQLAELTKAVGKKGIIRTVDQINKWVDIWSNSFEFTSRAAAYSVAKKNAIASGMTEAAARRQASAYAKNLANFEQVGEWGRAAGAWFMFFRPAATGAVRAIDSLAPAWQDVDTLIKRLPDDSPIKSDPVALAKFKETHAQLQKNARYMALGLLGAGATMYLMAYMLAGDDEQGRNKVATDDMARWTRYLRLPIGFLGGSNNDFLQLPWGFAFGAFGAAGAQIMGATMGKTSLADMGSNLVQIGIDSYLPIPFSRISPLTNPGAFLLDSAMPSVARPFLEYVMNMDGLGREIYNNRQSRVGDAYTGGDNIPEAYKMASKFIIETTNSMGYPVNISPNSLYFFANNYIDGLSRLAHNGMNIGMTVAGNKDFDAKTDLIFLDSFFGKKSNFDAREFASVENKIKGIERILNSFADHPKQYAKYVTDHPMHPGLVESYNENVQGLLKDVRHQANEIRKMSDLSPKDRKAILDTLVLSQNFIKRGMIETYKVYGIEP